MASNERIRKYLDAGNVLGQVSRGRAEEIVRELVNAGDIRRANAQEWVEALLDRSRRTSGQVGDRVRREVRTQRARFDGTPLDTVATQVTEALRKSARVGVTATRTVRSQAEHTASRVSARATTTAKGVQHRATTTAKGVQHRATTTASRARAAAGRVAPLRPADTARPAGGTSRQHKAAS